MDWKKGGHRLSWLVWAIALLAMAGLAVASGSLFGTGGVRSVPLTALTTSGDISTGVGIFTEATLAITVGILLLGAFSLQIARNYFLRTLDKFTLRLGADIWWLTYIMARDGMMFGIVLMGFELFFVGTYSDYAIAVPFMPLAIVLVATVLVLKLVRDPDEEEKNNRRVSILLTAAMMSYVFGILMVTENVAGYGASGYSFDPNTGVALSPTGGQDFWTFMFNTFSSQVNSQLALISFYACFAALSALALYALYWVLRVPPKAAGAKAPAAGAATKPATRTDAVQAKAQ